MVSLKCKFLLSDTCFLLLHFPHPLIFSSHNYVTTLSITSPPRSVFFSASTFHSHFQTPSFLFPLLALHLCPWSSFATDLDSTERTHPCLTNLLIWTGMPAVIVWPDCHLYLSLLSFLAQHTAVWCVCVRERACVCPICSTFLIPAGNYCVSRRKTEEDKKEKDEGMPGMPTESFTTVSFFLTPKLTHSSSFSGPLLFSTSASLSSVKIHPGAEG